MTNKITASNTYYFKAWNEDYKIGGVYHSLDSSEFRIMVILQSYVNNEGYIIKDSGDGYCFSTEITKMVGVNYRTLMRCLRSLSSKGLVEVFDDNNVIKLNLFIDDNVFRESNNTQSTRGRRMMAQQQQSNSAKLDKIMDKIDNPIVVVDGTAEILNTKQKEDNAKKFSGL